MMFRVVAGIVGLIALAACGGSGSDSDFTNSVSETSLIDPSSSSSTVALSATPTTVEVAPSIDFSSGEGSRYSFASVAELPDLPTEIKGWVPYTGIDAAGYSGLVRREEVRVFQGTPGVSILSGFSTQMNDCKSTIWIARWVVVNPDVTVIATNEADAVVPPEFITVEPWMLPPDAPAGIMSGSICFQPGFVFGSATDGSGANLVDVAVEWSYFDRDPFESSLNNGLGGAQTSSCSGFDYDDSLPIAVCSQGFSVSLFQEALGVEADGYFGPGTEAAIREFQASNGLKVTGLIDAPTWAKLGVTANVPFPDLNGDGVVDGSEFPGN